jgi:protocatechuate 3,4-dioxygenase beta subunit
VAVIDEAMWRAAWPGQNPLGKRFRMGGEQPWLTVIGLVGGIRGRGLAQDPRPGFYVSTRQRPATPVEVAVGRNAVILVRSDQSLDGLAESLQGAVRDVDPAQPVPDIATLEGIVAAGVAPQRFRALLFGAFATIALLTAVAGIYGVVAYLVSERTRELGIRQALGATPGDIVGSVLGWGLRLTAVGTAFGLLGVIAVTRYLSSLLFEISPIDLPTIVGAVAVVALVALSACLAPAMRAMGVDPRVTLRLGRSGGAGRLRVLSACLLCAGLLAQPATARAQSGGRSQEGSSPPARATLVGGPCEGCEAVFEYGERALTPTATLPDWEREGPRLELRGRIYRSDGVTPAAGVILYVYHTNQEGVYEAHGDEGGWARRHGVLRGWVRTDESGRYVFRTLLPGSYPDRSQAAHVHGTILEPDGRYYWIDAWRFRGDPLVDEEADDPDAARGGPGLVRLQRQGDLLVARRDIVLGRNVPGYEGVAVPARVSSATAIPARSPGR